MEKLLLRVTEAAELASVSRSTAYHLIASGTWPRVVVGRSVRVPLPALRAWIDRNTQPGRDLDNDPPGAL